MKLGDEERDLLLRGKAGAELPKGLGRVLLAYSSVGSGEVLQIYMVKSKIQCSEKLSSSMVSNWKIITSND